ncbi:MAG: TetR family transcriptional regulator [Solirubrobacteraceae bacterium]
MSGRRVTSEQPGTGPLRSGDGVPEVERREGRHVMEMQRRRLLSAVVELAFERGVQTLSVAVFCDRAGLSRRTFYDLFDDRDQCLHAAFLDALERAVHTITVAASGLERWRERIRAGLGALLSLLDHEPGMGRLLIVEGLGAGPQTLDVRKRVLTEAASAIEQGHTEARAGRTPPPLTAEGLVGAVLSVIQARMLERDPCPLTELTGPLMALIVHPYLGPAAAERELEVRTRTEPIVARRLPADPFKDLPIRLTYRTALVLGSIAKSPGSSSRQIADASGISDSGQISRLLTRLCLNGLIQDDGVGPSKGMARAWSLTERGEGILQATGQV